MVEAWLEQLMRFPNIGNSDNLPDIMSTECFGREIVINKSHDVVRFLSIQQWNRPRSLWLLEVMREL